MSLNDSLRKAFHPRGYIQRPMKIMWIRSGVETSGGLPVWPWYWEKRMALAHPLGRSMERQFEIIEERGWGSEWQRRGKGISIQWLSRTFARVQAVASWRAGQEWDRPISSFTYLVVFLDIFLFLMDEVTLTYLNPHPLFLLSDVLSSSLSLTPSPSFLQWSRIVSNVDIGCVRGRFAQSYELER